MINKKIKLNQQGITLIEVVLYLAIVAILFTALISFHLTLGGTATKVASNTDVSRNRRSALNSIDYLIKNADGLLKDVDGECSDFTSTPQVLALYFEDDTYLPGACVEGGGGVRISLDNRQAKLTCYPDIPYNGWYQACDTSVFTAGNAYYLTEPNVVVYNNNLSFATSTATSTANSFSNITTNIVVNTLSGGQLDVAATSTATSTVTIRNEQLSGLVSWWKFDEGSGTTPIDQSGDNNATCDGTDVPAYVTGIVTSSPYALDFESSNSSSYCYPTSPSNPDDLSFTDDFTLSAWVKVESLSTEHMIINNGAAENNKGYQLLVNSSGSARCRVYDGSTSADAATADSVIAADGSIYHIACVYDNSNDLFFVYVYKKNIGGVATSSAVGSIPTLVNDANNFYISSTTFDGVIDEVRVYNRALSVEEIWALQSSGL